VPSIGCLARSATLPTWPEEIVVAIHHWTYCLLCCVLLLQKQVLVVPLLCFFSSVSHPLSLNLTRFSPLLFAINFFLSWGLGAATIMQRYFKRKVPDGPSPSTDQQCLNWEDEIEFDPGKRKEISKYHPNIRDVVRRKYLENGPCQPRTLDFPSTKISRKIEDLILNGLMNLVVGLSIVNLVIKHIVFLVS
jgi:hypothetical protein